MDFFPVTLLGWNEDGEEKEHALHLVATKGYSRLLAPRLSVREAWRCYTAMVLDRAGPWFDEKGPLLFVLINLICL